MRGTARLAQKLWESVEVPMARPADRRARSAKQEEIARRTTVQLRNIPKSAMPSDIRRMLQTSKIENYREVHLDYHRFIPTSRAYIQFSDASFVKSALTSLNQSYIASHRIQASTTRYELSEDKQRSRGDEGRIEAIQRGAILGNGASAGVKADGRDVIMWGLPGMLEPWALKGYLRKLKLIENGPDGEPDCLAARVSAEDDKKRSHKRLTSRHVVRLPNTADAHRLVRRLHMTYYQPDSHGQKYQIHARVIY